MKSCPKCKGDLKAGPVIREPDGSEYFELTCLKCGERFADIKIPRSAMPYPPIEFTGDEPFS